MEFALHLQHESKRVQDGHFAREVESSSCRLAKIEALGLVSASNYLPGNTLNSHAFAANQVLQIRRFWRPTGILPFQHA